VIVISTHRSGTANQQESSRISSLIPNQLFQQPQQTSSVQQHGRTRFTFHECVVSSHSAINRQIPLTISPSTLRLQNNYLVSPSHATYPHFAQQCYLPPPVANVSPSHASYPHFPQLCYLPPPIVNLPASSSRRQYADILTLAHPHIVQNTSLPAGMPVVNQR